MSKFNITLFLTFLLTASVSACGQTTKVSSTTKSDSTAACKSLETREPNAEEQKPTFPEQTRACGVKTKTPYKVTVVAKGLDRPWAVEQLPDGDFLITEKGGTMRVVSKDGKVGEPLVGILPVGASGEAKTNFKGGMPPVTARGQGGLLDVALSPDFDENRMIFWSFSETREGGNSGTSVASGKLSKDKTKVEDVKIIFRAMPGFTYPLHFGSRIVFGKDSKLYVTTGDRFHPNNRQKVQELDNHLGKIMRINPDGSVPKDNPFVGKEGAKPEIWDLGHRNIQSATIDMQGRIWTVEHGPRGGDELNLIKKGQNYGWPVVSFGQEYSGRAISTAQTKRKGFVDPVYYWDPVIAPSGMEVYSGLMIPEWRGNIFIGGLVTQKLVRLIIQDEKVVGEEHLLTDRGERIRDVREGMMDNFLYVVTDSGELWRIEPEKKPKM